MVTRIQYVYCNVDLLLASQYSRGEKSENIQTKILKKKEKRIIKQINNKQALNPHYSKHIVF
jgi:hypothetical protein